MAERADIRVLSWNINGLKAKLKMKQLKKEERKTKLLKIFDQYDVVLLQETKIGEMKDDKDYNKNWEIITEALSNKYKLKKLKDQTLRDTADNQEEEEEGGEEEEEEEGGEAAGGRRGRRRRREEGGEAEEDEKEVEEDDEDEEEEEDEKKVEEDEEDEEEEEDKKKEKETRSATMYMTYFNSRMKGVAILINKPHTLLKASEGGYYAWVHVKIGGQRYTFVSVYYHPDADDQIRNLMTEILTDRSGAFTARLVIGGDFNTTLDPDLDTANKQNTDNRDHAARRQIVNEFLNEANMVDVWREMHPEDREYTYNHQSRLDYIFILRDDLTHVESCEILSDIDLSDHSPVSLTLNYRDSEQPKEE